jgi:hypothetical protein
LEQNEFLLQERNYPLVLQSQKGKMANWPSFGSFGRTNRGVVERFIAPVLKTGDLSRGPGVRIPPPLLQQFQVKLKSRIPYEFEAFCFYTSISFKNSQSLGDPSGHPKKFQSRVTESAKTSQNQIKTMTNAMKS